jgi:hypothetical protein
MRVHSPNGKSISIHYCIKLAGFQRGPDSPFLITTVCFRGELDDCVERDLDVG